MSDQLEQVSVEGEVAEQTTERETSAPSYLTREEAESIFQKKVDEALNRQVGLYTKGTEKLRQRLEQLEQHKRLLKKWQTLFSVLLLIEIQGILTFLSVKLLL